MFFHKSRVPVLFTDLIPQLSLRTTWRLLKISPVVNSVPAPVAGPKHQEQELPSLRVESLDCTHQDEAVTPEKGKTSTPTMQPKKHICLGGFQFVLRCEWCALDLQGLFLPPY